MGAGLSSVQTQGVTLRGNGTRPGSLPKLRRLCTRYKKVAAKGKNKPQIVTAIARELLGFAWAIAIETEPQPQAA